MHLLNSVLWLNFFFQACFILISRKLCCFVLSPSAPTGGHWVPDKAFSWRNSSRKPIEDFHCSKIVVLNLIQEIRIWIEPERKTHTKVAHSWWLQRETQSRGLKLITSRIPSQCIRGDTDRSTYILRSQYILSLRELHNIN